MVNLARRDLVVGDDDAHADAGRAPQVFCERLGQADAAVGSRIVRDHALVQRDSGPGDPLHEIHRGVFVDIGAVIAILLDDAEHAGRGREPALPGRDPRMRDRLGAGVERQLLPVERDHDRQRPLRFGMRFAGDGHLGGLLA